MTLKANEEKRPRISSAKREALLGYLLVAPTLLLIFVVALFPVLRTFWLSTFDLRLNNRALSKTYLSYQLDVEFYAESYYRFDIALENLSNSTDKQIAQTSQDIRIKVHEAHSSFLLDQGLESQYNAAFEIMLSMKPVLDENIRVKLISEESGKELSAIYSEFKSELTNLYKLTQDREVKLAYQITDDILGSFRPPNFIGLNNYKELLSDSRLGLSFLNTVNFAVFAVFFELVFGIALAMLMNMGFKGRGVVRAAVLIPWSIPAAVSALIWRFMYDGQYGIISKMFAFVGIIGDPSYILTTRSGAIFGLIFADTWKTTPFMALLILAGLQTINADLYEAARIDGASPIQQFFKIVLPLLKPSIMVALLFRTLDTFKVFDLVSVMTNGGPANSTETISVFAYKSMFANMNFGMGSAIAGILFVVLAIVIIVYVKVLGTDLFKRD